MRLHAVLPPHCPYRIAVETFEREMLERALAGAGGNVGTAADRLGVSRKYLYDRFKALGVAVRHPRTGPPRSPGRPRNPLADVGTDLVVDVDEPDPIDPLPPILDL